MHFALLSGKVFLSQQDSRLCGGGEALKGFAVLEEIFRAVDLDMNSSLETFHRERDICGSLKCDASLYMRISLVVVVAVIVDIYFYSYYYFFFYYY